MGVYVAEHEKATKDRQVIFAIVPQLFPEVISTEHRNAA